ncbi:MAG: TetR/AcrR family transcriptional regulator [Planctomycetota bacterium]
MRAPKHTREEVLDRISEVFRRFGYDGASLQRISAATDLGRASLYHHFPGGKEEMAREVFARVEAEVTECMLAPLAAEGAPEKRVAAWAKGVERFFAKGEKNCLLGTMLLSGGSDLFSEEIAGAFRALIDALARVIHDAGIPRAEARRRAENGMGRIQGGLIVSRGLRSPKHFQRVVRELPRELLAT